MQFESLVGSWSKLADRLNRRGALARWAAAEPALAAVSSINAVRALTENPTDRAAVDELVGALIRVAAVDGGNDADTALVVLHLLRNGICRMAQRLGHRGPQVMALVVGEVTCVIRSYPWRRRTRSYAAGVLLDAKHALWYGELTPVDDPRRPAAAILIDPADLQRSSAHRPVESVEIELMDVLLWAASSGVITVGEAQLLIDTEHGRAYGAGTRAAVAAAAGIPERTFRRKRQQTLAALADAASDYVAAVA